MLISFTVLGGCQPIFIFGKLGKISKVEVGFHGESALENNIKDIL